MSDYKTPKLATKILALITTSVMCLSLVSCVTTVTTGVDILTLKETPAEKTQITVLVKHAFSINEFEKIVEEKFPEIDLVQVGNYTRDMGISEYYARLEHDDLTDIVMTWPLDVGTEYLSDRLLDLSGMEYTSRYNVSMLNETTVDGKLYYLPGPSQVRGILYNKTMFAENNWEVPTDYDGFLKLCATIEESGIKALQLGLKNKEVLDTAFIGYNFGSSLSSPQDFQWLDAYNQGVGSFGTQFDTALDVYQQMIDAKVFTPSDLEVDYSQREQMLFTRQCAMIEDSVLMARLGHDQTGTEDEFALMPFFNPGENNNWARLYMVCFIGLNKHLAEPANRAKYALVTKLMNYISTVEGQEALTADTGAMYSSLTGTSAPKVPEIEKLAPVLNEGRFAIFPTLKNSQSALRDGLAGMLKGTLTKQEVITMVDNQNNSPPIIDPPALLGSATDDFTLTQTGILVTDTLRTFSGCDIALFLDNGKDGRTNAKGLGGRIYKGDITSKDIDRIMPDLKSGDLGAICKASISGKDLLYTLEHSVSVGNEQSNWFYYFSGLKMTFNPTAPAGERVVDISLIDGQKINPERMYTIAFSEGSVPENLLQNYEKTNTLTYDLLTQTIKDLGTLTPPTNNRFSLIHK